MTSRAGDEKTANLFLQCIAVDESRPLPTHTRTHIRPAVCFSPPVSCLGDHRSVLDNPGSGAGQLVRIIGLCSASLTLSHSTRSLNPVFHAARYYSATFTLLYVTMKHRMVPRFCNCYLILFSKACFT